MLGSHCCDWPFLSSDFEFLNKEGQTSKTKEEKEETMQVGGPTNTADRPLNIIFYCHDVHLKTERLSTSTSQNIRSAAVSPKHQEFQK